VRQNETKRNLQSGRAVFGPYVSEFFTPGLARIAANAGSDFIIYDMEHCGWSIETLRQQIASCHAAGLTPIVNTPEMHRERFGLFLDIGAMGLMVPHVETRAQAEELVRSTRFPPEGSRGGAFGIAHDDYVTGDPRATVASENARTMIIAKIESRRGISNAPDILSVPGIDVALVTSGDLTLDMGIPGEPDHHEIVAAVEKIRGICDEKGKAAGYAVFDLETGKKKLKEGFRFIQYSWDIGLFGDALKLGISALRSESANL
jgi:2-keto-3-deoxy-L-rhamnonate aldolase RhmA